MVGLNKVHKLRPFLEARISDRRVTFCGLTGVLAPGTNTEFDTITGNRFEATDGKSGVTCARCRGLCAIDQRLIPSPLARRRNSNDGNLAQRRQRQPL